MRSGKRSLLLAFCVLLLLALASRPAMGQAARALTLEEARQKALDHYPLSRQRDLLRQSEHISLSNLNRAYLPQLGISGQATYQSEVTRIEIPFPDFQVQPLSKDQYRVQAEVSQLVYDGGAVRAQKGLQQLSTQVEQQRLEVELYQLRERIDQVYLGILLLDQQAGQAALILRDLETGIQKTRAQVNNGAAFRSSLDVLLAEQLKAGQRVAELQASRKGLVATLGLFLNEPLDPAATFQMPAAPPLPAGLSRPELDLYQGQSLLLAGQKGLVHARSRPRLSLFGQGGYGRPGFNFLRNDFAFFSLAGVRLSWGLEKFYTLKNELRLLDLHDRMLGLQREAFILNTNTQLARQQAEIDKLEALIRSDQQIIVLRERVKRAAQAQLANSVITSSDYIREVNAEDQARQALILHQLQLLQARLQYQTLAGF